jgi:coproporphyrinogen III oxidase
MMPLSQTPDMLARRDRAEAWFMTLQSRLLDALAAIEREAEGPFFADAPGAGTPEYKTWERRNADGTPGGGGRMGMLRGRVIEKAGVHVSHVYGQFAPEFAAQIPGAAEDPHFAATGISVIIHPWNPNAPTVHMNTRYVVTSKAWFGGGADLTPVLDRRRRQDDADSVAFHGAMKAVCLDHGVDYGRYKAWCDEYFHLKHRDEPRGIGGIFYDYHDSGDWEADFAFTQGVGEAFLAIYPLLLSQNMVTPWTEADVREQEIRRGRYVEFNLLYDRGTLFGLKTGGNVESILSSMPPRVRWP